MCLETRENGLVVEPVRVSILSPKKREGTENTESQNHQPQTDYT